jgi:hypothetical protein
MRKMIFFAIILFSTVAFSQPVINSFSPVSGPVGVAVTIKGMGFSATPALNTVYFGAIKATVSSSTDTTIIASVPVGTTYQPITVTTNNLTAYSVNSFIVTFSGGGGPFISTSFLPKVDQAAGIYPHSVAIADFNNDGKSDVLVSKSSSSNVSIFQNSSIPGAISFAGRSDLPVTGNSHEGCATGDIDGDGKIDFVITNSYNPSSVSIFRNTSSAAAISFAPKVDYAADNAPYSVAIGDLNGDGKPDLAIANNGSNLITVYKNTSTPGNISFAGRIDFTVGTNPYSVAIGDLDGDGKADLAVTLQGSSSALSVMKNNSAGGVISFAAAVVYAPLVAPFIVAIGDLNGDNKPDLAAANSSNNQVVVLKNTSSPGSISFAPQLSFTVDAYPVCVAISDLDGDGKPDLISSNRSSNNVSALQNISSGGNISFAAHAEWLVNTDPFYVAAGDLDGDSRPDLVAANSATAFISVLQNIIGANIAPAITSFSPTSGANGTQITILGSNFTGATAVKFGGVNAFFFNVDSATGITAVVGSGASGDVSVTTSTGTAFKPGFNYTGPTITSFSPVVGVSGTVVTITGTNLTAATSVKFGGTNALSFIVNSSTSISATVGSGSTGNVTVTTPGGTASLPGFIYGPPAITSFSPTSGAVGSTIIINGNNFSPATSSNMVFFGAVKANVVSASASQLTVTVPAGATYEPIRVSTGNLTAYSSLPFSVVFASDNPQLNSASFAQYANYAAGIYPTDVRLCDLNNDGKPDLVTANNNSNTISILKNSTSNNTLSFDPKIDFATGPVPKKIAFGDLDGDGNPDIVVTNFNSGNASTISVFQNTTSGGTISLAPKVDYATGNGSLGLFVTDINIDGKPDIAVSSGNSGFFSVFINTTTSVGNISFAAKQDFPLLTHPDQLTMADLDGDGKPEVITANFSAANISVFRNTSSGGPASFAARIDFAAGSQPNYVSTGDLDADGKIDIILTNYGSSNISLFKNSSTAGNISLSRQDLAVSATNVSASDLNGDGKVDLFTGKYLTGVVSVLENTYTGTNFSFGTSIDYTTGNYDTYVTSGDLDGDGKPELAVVNTLLNNVSILKNKVSEPVVSGLSSTTAGNGSTITITGNNFTGTTSVKFGGTPANSFTVVSSSRIDAVLGGGASGNVTVTTPLGTSSIPGFSFIPAIFTEGPATFCDGAFIILSSSASANNQWYKNSVLISGATSTTLQVTTGGSYTVSTTSNSVTTTSAAVMITVTTVPVPAITLSNNLLVSNSATGNQWYFNGNLIAGATNQMYQPSQSGNYTVTVTAGACTSNPSAPFTFTITGIIDLGNGQYIRVYPNPATNNLYVDWNINNTSILNVEIVNLEGKLTVSKRNVNRLQAIDLSLLPPGIYFIRVYNEKFTVDHTIKIVKLN